MRRLITVLLSLTTIVAFLLSEISVFAEERVGFSVEAQLPENQLNEKNTFFDLRVEPGQEQELETIVYNHGNEEITVHVSLYDASTNSNGLVVYEEQEELDSSLKQPVTEIVTLEQDKITIPAGESTVVTASVTVPEEPFEGIKLGGLHFEKVPEETAEAEKGVTIQNKYAYVIGLQLSESDEKVAPELHLNSVEPTLVNHRTAVVANLQNSQPVLMRNVTIDAKVFEEDETEAIKELHQENVNIAPNSNMDVVIDWENQPLTAGNYRLELQASDGTNEWEWEEKFTISEEAKTLNEEAVELETEGSYLGWFIAGIALLIVIILILLAYIKKLKTQR